MGRNSRVTACRARTVGGWRLAARGWGLEVRGWGLGVRGWGLGVGSKQVAIQLQNQGILGRYPD